MWLLFVQFSNAAIYLRLALGGIATFVVGYPHDDLCGFLTHWLALCVEQLGHEGIIYLCIDLCCQAFALAADLAVGADDLLHGEVGYSNTDFIAGEPCCFYFEKQLLIANKLGYPAEVIGGEGKCHIMD